MAPHYRRWVTAAGRLAPLALTLLLYAPTLTLPYFWDDFPLFNFVTAKSFVQLWTDVTGLPYYRPIAFTLYKIASELLPYGATLLPRLFMLLVHAANSWLAGYLAGQLWARAGQTAAGRVWVERLAGLAFAAYPFAALPLVHFAAVHHPVVILITLSGVLAVIRFTQTARGRWLALSLAGAALAPYALEAGVAAGSVMAVAWLVFDRGSARRRPWALALLPVLSALFLPVWVLVPKSRPDEAAVPLQFAHPETLAASATFFWQALTYPVQPLATLWLKYLGGWDLGVVWAVGAAASVPAAVWLWRRGQWRTVVLAAAWTGLTSLPSIGALPFDYIIISPRLLYYPGAGGVLLWTAALVSLVATETAAWRRVWPRWALGAALGAGLLVVPAAYLARHARLHVLALSPLAQLNTIARAAPTEQHLVLNTINWLAYKQPWYPLGGDGVPVLAPYLTVLDLVYTNTGLRWPAEVATFPDLRPDLNDHWLATANEEPGQLWDFARFAAQVAQYQRVWLTQYTDEQAVTGDVGAVTAGPAAPPAAYLARFADAVYLTDAGFITQGQTLTVTLDWVVTQPAALSPDAVVFRNAFDCAGHFIGPGSGHPLGGLLLLTALPAGARVHDVRAIPLEALAADGCYQVEVGFFRADGARLPAFAPDGGELPDQLYRVQP